MDTISVLLWMDNDYNPPRMAVTMYGDLPEDIDPIRAQALQENVIIIPADTTLLNILDVCKAAALIQDKVIHQGT